jgi:hypothetical protein
MVDFFFLLLFLFGIAIFLRMDWIYYLIYVVGGVWLFSHWWVRRSLSRITVSRRLTPHACDIGAIRSPRRACHQSNGVNPPSGFNNQN